VTAPPRPPDSLLSAAAAVSVVVPAYDAERYVGEALESVLSQSPRPGEVIVVDDGSADATASVASGFPGVRVVRQANAGAAAARNAGLAIAAGGLLAFLDADDLWTAGKLEAQLRALEDPDVDLVFGHAEHFLSPDAAGDVAGRFRVPEGALPGYSSCAMLARREAFLRAGPFDATFRCGEFVEWYARARDAGLRSRMLEQVVMRRRVHDANGGILRRDARSDYARLLKESLDRRRAARDG